MSGAFFEAQRSKVELRALRDGLDSNDPTNRMKAAKKVIALMRAGENVGELFSSMLRCVKTDDMKLKRLVYNYIVTYSQEQSEEAIMVVNVFVQETRSFNPLVRALAIRTMSRIRLDTVAESMLIPLKEVLHDADPFVRKTAALAVAKVYDVIPEEVENSGLFEHLIQLMVDENPMVVSNTTAAIIEINEKRSAPIFTFDAGAASSIVNAIPSSTEWCQTILFDALSKYEPETAEKAAEMIDRLVPFLKCANPSVVIGAFKCIFLFMDFDERRPQDLFTVILPPFITLVTGADPEIQFVVLRTLNLFVKKYPKALAKEVRIFFCKYNDPSYVKMEKLDIIVTNCHATNVNVVLDELAEYCNSVDVQFVRKTIRVIGQLALKMAASARRCADILVKVVEGKAEYAIEEAIIVVADLLRRYPGEFESIIGKVCTNIEALKDPRARAALIWILGEYNGLIEHVDALLDPFLDTFHDEDYEVQVQLITAIVKIYIENPNDTKDQLQFLLSEATKESVLPDVRNRAFMYWRLLTLDSSGARDIVSVEKGEVDPSGSQFTDEVLMELIRNMGSVSGTLHIVPSRFATKKNFAVDESERERQWHDVVMRNSENPVSICADWDSTHYHVQIMNLTKERLSKLALAVNVNGVGFTIGSCDFVSVLEPDSSCIVPVPYEFQQSAVKSGSAMTLDFALRTSAGVVYFRDFIDFRLVTTPRFVLYRADFLKLWKKGETQSSFVIPGTLVENDQLKERGICVVADRDGEVCAAFELPGHRAYVGDIEFQAGQIRVTVKGDPILFPFIKESAERALCVD